jgi:hypothetical protein
VGVALGGADLGVAEQSSNHFQRGAAGHQQGCESVAQIVNADIGDVGLHAHPFPKALEIDHRLARYIAGEEVGAALGHGIPAQPDQGDGLVRDRHPVDATLFGIGRLFCPDGEVEVELIEGGGAGLAAASAGQHAQADDPCCALIRIGTEGVGQALDFVEGEEALAGRFRALAEAGRWIVGAHFPSDGEAEHFAQHLADAVCPHRRRLERLRRRLGFGLLCFERPGHRDRLDGFLPDPWPPCRDLDQQPVDIGRRDVGHFARSPFGQDQRLEHAGLILAAGSGQFRQMLIDVPIDQFIQGWRMPRIGPRVHRIFAAINVALQALGFFAGGDHRPAGPCTDRHAPLPPGGAVDQDEGLAAGQEHAKPEARAILIKNHILARADFGSLYNAFRQVRSHAGPPFQAD